MRASARIFAFLGCCAVIVAIVFPLLAREPAGSMMLGVFALSMLYIAWELSRGAATDRSDNVEAEAEVGPEHVFPSSWWPAPMALGIALLAIGFRFSPALIAVGAATLALTVAGWFFQRVQAEHAAPEHAAHEQPVAEGASSHGGELAEATTAHEIGQDHG